MDQLRTAFAWLKQYHFWVLTVLVALIGLGSWWSAAGSLSQQYKENESKITTEFNSLASLRSNPFHPNERINELQAQEIAKLAKDVGAIWQKLYDRQREHVLEWPSALSQAFRDHVKDLAFGADIPPHLLQNYQDYVERHFPKLPEKIGARVLREGEGGQYGGEGGFSRRSFGGEGGPAMLSSGEEEDDGDYIVEWLDQAHVREELDFPQTPSPLRVWWTQENLWVYHTLLDVIRNTNEAAGATRKSNAAVRIIYAMDVGRQAAEGSRTNDRIFKLATATPGGGEGGFGEMGMEGGEGGRLMVGEGGPDMGMGMGFREGGVGQGPMSPEQEQAFLLSHRYLDADGNPIPAGGGGGDSMGGEFADPSAPAQPVDLSAFGTEYKRLPVRMVLHMDHRWLPELISQCASQPLQVEVQQVRINPADGGGAGGGGLGGGVRSFEGGGGMGGSPFPDRSGLQTFPQQPQMVDVVIQGIVYIFRKPNPSDLEPTGEPPLAGM